MADSRRPDHLVLSLWGMEKQPEGKFLASTYGAER